MESTAEFLLPVDEIWLNLMIEIDRDAKCRWSDRSCCSRLNS